MIKSVLDSFGYTLYIVKAFRWILFFCSNTVNIFFQFFNSIYIRKLRIKLFPVIVLCLRKNNIPYRAVLFPHHYAIEVFVENNWFYFDPNMEPEITREQRMETSWKHHSDTLKQYYDTFLFKDLNYIFGVGLTAPNGPVNQIPAPNARLFQATTRILSKIVWCVPLLLFFFYSEIRSRSGGGVL